MRMTDLKPGWAVVGNDGGRIGTIREVGQNYLLTSTRGLSRDIYVPASAIANVTRETVQLNVTKADAEASGWEQPPRTEDDPDTTREGDLHRHV